MAMAHASGGAKRACVVGFERCVGTLVHEETGAT